MSFKGVGHRDSEQSYMGKTATLHLVQGVSNSSSQHTQIPININKTVWQLRLTSEGSVIVYVHCLVEMKTNAVSFAGER